MALWSPRSERSNGVADGCSPILWLYCLRVLLPAPTPHLWRRWRRRRRFVVRACPRGTVPLPCAGALSARTEHSGRCHRGERVFLGRLGPLLCVCMLRCECISALCWEGVPRPTMVLRARSGVRCVFAVVGVPSFKSVIFFCFFSAAVYVYDERERVTTLRDSNNENKNNTK